MKTKFLLFATAILALSFTSCDNDDSTPTPPGETTEAYINASSSTIWQYYSFAENKVVGSAEGNDENDAAWAKRKDWDIAIRKMYVRTNSGTSTAVSANGGVFSFDINNKDKAGNITATTSFSSVQNVPDEAVIAPDAIVTYASMGGSITTSQSSVVVTAMKKNEDGTTIMPPVYLKSPVYIFRTANGNTYYKVDFTQYQNDSGTAGHVKFNFAQLYKN